MDATTTTTPPQADFALPGVDSLLEGLAPILRVLVMAAPLVLLGLGLCYFLLPAKEATFSVGYRFRYGMSRVAVWQFMQRLAGMVFGGLGLVLTVVMALLCLKLENLPTMDSLWFSISCLLWELGLTVAAILAIDITVVALYDRNGTLRSELSKEEE